MTKKGSITSILIFASLLMVAGGGLSSDDGSILDLTTLQDMNISRYNHTATALTQGDNIIVLVAGGTQDGRTSISSAEVLEDDKWVMVDPMLSPRMRHSAVEVGNKVLVTGGFIGDGHPSLLHHFNGTGNQSLSSCEVFDVQTGEWTFMSPMRTGRFWHGTVVLDDNKVLVIGGSNVSSGALSSCEIYDPVSDSWQEFPSLPIPLTRFAYGISGNGDIIVAGGHEGLIKRSMDRVFIFESGGEDWKEVAQMNHPRGYPGFTFIDDDLFVVSGGFSSPGEPDRSDAEIYDIQTDSWTSYGDLLFPRHGQGSVFIDEMGILIAGGSNCETGGCHSNIEIFDGNTGEWMDSGHLINARKWCQVTPIPHGAVVTGGKACNYPTPNTEMLIFDPMSDISGSKNGEIDPLDWISIAALVIIFIITMNLIITKRG